MTSILEIGDRIKIGSRIYEISSFVNDGELKKKGYNICIVEANNPGGEIIVLHNTVHYEKI